MKSRYRKNLETLENLILIQMDSNEKGYMHGMLNGMILGHSIMSNCSPKFQTAPKQKNKVRHKTRKK